MGRRNGRSKMRRLEIPEDMQKYGFAPLGGASGPIKQAIFGLNSARLCHINLKAADARPLPAYSEDRLAQLKKKYEFAAKEPSNLVTATSPGDRGPDCTRLRRA
jgi:hypothetical protein